MPALYHFWSWPEAQRVRLALGFKGADFEDHPLVYGDDESFFELGVARSVPVLRLDDGSLLTDSVQILRDIDDLFPDGPPLVAVHGTPWSSFNLRHLIESLSKAFTVHYYDLLGYGQSEKAPGDVSLGIQN
ncbi:MAG: glutathione S-transferase N-terminal domain-containing protein, partial [Acidihalobacter sp.]